VLVGGGIVVAAVALVIRAERPRRTPDAVAGEPGPCPADPDIQN
jgi:hypothetical protein